MRKIIKIFTSQSCPNCPPAKVMGEELKNKGFDVRMFDVSEADGLAEAQICGIMAVPTVIIADENDDEIFSWRSGVPRMEEVEERVK